MNFLVDAQLPQKLAALLRASGHDVTHTLDLPGGTRTSDAEICKRAEDEGRIVATKDADFMDT